MAHPGDNVCSIALDFHPAATAVPLLAPPQLPVDEILVHSQPGGQTGKERYQSLTVRFPGGKVAEHKRSILNDAHDEIGTRVPGK
jgi:hypothetical protein